MKTTGKHDNFPPPLVLLRLDFLHSAILPSFTITTILRIATIITIVNINTNTLSTIPDIIINLITIVIVIVIITVMRHEGRRVGAVLRVLAFHQCAPDSIPGLGVISGLSLLVLYSAPRRFSPGTPVFPSHLKPTFLNSNSIRMQYLPENHFVEWIFLGKNS